MLQPQQMPHGDSNPLRTHRKPRTAVRGAQGWVVTAKALSRLLILMVIGVAGIAVFAQQSSVSSIVGRVHGCHRGGRGRSYGSRREPGHSRGACRGQ